MAFVPHFERVASPRPARHRDPSGFADDGFEAVLIDHRRSLAQPGPD